MRFICTWVMVCLMLFYSNENWNFVHYNVAIKISNLESVCLPYDSSPSTIVTKVEDYFNLNVTCCSSHKITKCDNNPAQNKQNRPQNICEYEQTILNCRKIFQQ